MACNPSFLGLNSSPPARPRDPSPARLRAAAGFGRLVAAGLMDRAECLEALAAGQTFCARVRLAHALTDATLHWGRARRRAERAVRTALAGQLGGEARLPSATLRGAAHDANRALGYPLRAAEVEALAARVLARAMAHAH